MKKKSIKIDGVEYEVRELTTGQGAHIFAGEQDNIVLNLAKASIYADGEALGDKLDDLGLSVTMRLLPIVNEIYGLSEGND